MHRPGRRRRGGASRPVPLGVVTGESPIDERAAEPRYVVGSSAPSISSARQARVGSASSSASERPPAPARQRGVAHERASGGAAEPLGEEERDPLGDDLPTGEVEVRAHPGRRRPRDPPATRRARPPRPRRTQRARERLPLRLPGAGGPLVLLDERSGEDGGVRARELRRRRASSSRRPRCACAASRTSRPPRRLRVPRRPPSGRAARRRGRSWRRTPAAMSSAAPSSAIRTRFVCQGSVGLREAELGGKEAGDLRPVLAERRERAGGPTELRREAVDAQLAQAGRARRARRRASLPP